MLYLVTGKLINREPMAKPHGEFVDFLREAVRPSLIQLEKLRNEGLVLAGGVRACSQSLAFVVQVPEAKSHIEVRQLLFQLPVFSYFEWEATPLESFEEWLTIIAS